MPHSVSQPNDALPGPAPQPPAARPTGKRVLVIDDDDAVRKSLSAILTARGFLAVEADSGPAALDSLRGASAPIDAVILDHNMPGMNGREVLAALRAMHPELPVVIASGFDVESAADLADARLRFVQKSLGPRALLAQLGELLQPAA
jgi:CheY-like chemotaxis protein